jgi:hypothetical protein
MSLLVQTYHPTTDPTITYSIAGIAHLERKFRESLIVSFVPNDVGDMPATGEYMVKVGEYNRKLVVSH